jgi:hypothetical protein
MFGYFLFFIYLALVVGDEWSMTEIEGITTLIGLDSLGKENVAAAIGQNGRGCGYLTSTDGCESSKFYIPAGGLLNMDIAMDSNDFGVMVGVSKIYVKQPGSTDFAATDSQIRCSSQSVSRFLSGPGKVGVPGYVTDSEGAKNGVAVTLDSGKTWTGFDTGRNSSQYPSRYAAFPTDSTWFVSQGTWPMTEDEADKVSQGHKKYSSRFTASVTENKGSPLHKLHTNSKIVKGEDSGFYGAVMKTTDGGKTWSEVLNTKGEYYFNAISCSDENNCVAVAESGDTAVGYRTTDSGATWTMVVTPEMGAGLSMMAAFSVSPDEYWLAGGVPGRQGVFWHGKGDAAPTKSTLQGAYAADMSFDQGVGYAAVLGMNTCGIATYGS